MNKRELAIILKQENIRPDSYNLEGRLYDDCLILEESHGVWFIYYSERGLRSDMGEFKSESDACKHFLKLARKS